MSDHSRWLTWQDLDQEEIGRRGFRNCGDEDWDFFRCPHCQKVFLVDGEADGLWADPSNPDDIQSIPGDRVCTACGEQLPIALCGPNAPSALRVTPEMLRRTGWGWALKDAIP